MKFTLQELYDGLNGANFRYYVNLINSTLHGELDNYDELYWMPNDEYSLDMIMEGLHWTNFELLRILSMIAIVILHFNLFGKILSNITITKHKNTQYWVFLFLISF